MLNKLLSERYQVRTSLCDEDEEDLSAPVLSVSLGDDCIFRVGGKERIDRTKSLKLISGDVLVLGGEARLCYHGVDRIDFGTSTLLSSGGRINLTLRSGDVLTSNFRVFIRFIWI